MQERGPQVLPAQQPQKASMCWGCAGGQLSAVRRQHEGTFAPVTCRCFRCGPLSVGKVQAGVKGAPACVLSVAAAGFSETHREASGTTARITCVVHRRSRRAGHAHGLGVCETPVLPKDRAPERPPPVRRGACARVRACVCACACARVPPGGLGRNFKGQCEIRSWAVVRGGPGRTRLGGPSS